MASRKESEFRTAPLLACFFIAVVLAALLGAITNNTILDLVKGAQPFLTGLAAIAAALIAYDAQAANAREARRKDDLDRLQARGNHLINIFTEVDALSPYRIAICKVCARMKDDPAMKECRELSDEMEKLQFPSINKAFESIGIFEPETRAYISTAALQHRYRRLDIESLRSIKPTSSTWSARAIMISSMQGVWLFELAINELLDALDKELAGLGLNTRSQFFDQRDQIAVLIPAISATIDHLKDLNGQHGVPPSAASAPSVRR